MESNNKGNGLSRTYPLVLLFQNQTGEHTRDIKRLDHHCGGLKRYRRMISKVSLSKDCRTCPTELAKSTQEPNESFNTMQRRSILAPFQFPSFVHAQGSLLSSELSLGGARVSDRCTRGSFT